MDYRRKLPGRGAWVCPVPACLRGALSGGFARTFRAGVPKGSGDALELLQEIHRNAHRAALDLLGLHRRMGKLVLGSDAVRKALQQRSLALLVISRDFSENSRQQIMPRIGEGLPVFSFSDKEELGGAVGHAPVGLVAVTKTGGGLGLSAPASRLLVELERCGSPMVQPSPGLAQAEKSGRTELL